MDIEVDHLEQRCPRLGSSVSFNYCFTCGDYKQPCWKIMDCWWEKFDILSYLKENLPKEMVNQIVDTKPKPKITSIIELIEQANKRRGKE